MELLCASWVQPVMLNVVYTTFMEHVDTRKEEVQSGKVGDKAAKFGAKGNMTAFMLPFEKVVEQLDIGQTLLPRTGQDLSGLVVVTLMYKGNEPGAFIVCA